jgi:hypothetical protein
VLDNLIAGFFQNQIKESYQAIKDPSWPEIETLEDFDQLPEHIKQECIEQHHLELLVLDKSHPDCSRKILREFFKEGFKHPAQHGFIKQQQKFVYDNSKSVFVWPFACFYDQDSFKTKLKQLSSWAGVEWNDGVMDLHREFLARQPYINSKSKCDTILQKIGSGENFNLGPLDLLEESYIWASLENQHACSIHNADPWYTNSQQLVNSLQRFI